MTSKLLRALMGGVVLAVCAPGIASAQIESAPAAARAADPPARVEDAASAPALKAARQRFVRAFSGRSVGRITPLFTEDARLYSNGQNLSPSAFAEVVLALDVRGATWSPGATSFVSPVRVREEGRYSIQGRREAYTGDYTIVWQHQAGQEWQITELRLTER